MRPYNRGPTYTLYIPITIYTIYYKSLRNVIVSEVHGRRVPIARGILFIRLKAYYKTKPAEYFFLPRVCVITFVDSCENKNSKKTHVFSSYFSQ